MFSKIFILLPIMALATLMGVISCSEQTKLGSLGKYWYSYGSRAQTAEWIKESPKITLLHRQVNGRNDGASSWDNISVTANGGSAKRSWYGTAPGGYTKLDIRMLRAMKTLAQEGYTFNVTSIAGGSHSRTSRHYAGTAFDVSTINGQKVRYGSSYWRAFLRRCRQLGATETLGPGDRGHSTHIHAAWPR